MDWGHRGQFRAPFGDIEDTLADLQKGFGRGTIRMPWRELTVIEQREEFVRLAGQPGANISELCRRFGIGRSNGHKWLARYAAQGGSGR